jgi:hypothetical protein
MPALREGAIEPNTMPPTISATIMVAVSPTTSQLLVHCGRDQLQEKRARGSKESANAADASSSLRLFLGVRRMPRERDRLWVRFRQQFQTKRAVVVPQKPLS